VKRMQLITSGRVRLNRKTTPSGIMLRMRKNSNSHRQVAKAGRRSGGGRFDCADARALRFPKKPISV
jgi:hypothetical protein